jgi:hypothetical protein|nr:MAG TPA: hypothetical protein [Caudoviricetes sp.]
MIVKSCNNRLTDKELEKIKVEKYVESLFTRDERRSAVLNATRYLEKNGPAGVFSDSAIDVVDAIAFAFAAGELEWVKDLGREEE